MTDMETAIARATEAADLAMRDAIARWRTMSAERIGRAWNRAFMAALAAEMDKAGLKVVGPVASEQELHAAFYAEQEAPISDRADYLKSRMRDRKAMHAAATCELQRAMKGDGDVG